MGTCSQRLELLVQRLELRLEVLVANLFARRNADVAARVEAPALRLDLLHAHDFAEARHVRVLRLLAEDLCQLRARFLAAEGQVERLPAIEPDDVRKEPELSRSPVAVCAVDLPVYVAGVDEEHLVLPLRLRLASVEEPKGAGQGTV